MPDSVPHYFYGPKDAPMAREADGTERAVTASELLDHFPNTRRWPRGPARTVETEPRNR
jgi:hypothetical protein